VSLEVLKKRINLVEVVQWRRDAHQRMRSPVTEAAVSVLDEAGGPFEMRHGFRSHVVSSSQCLLFAD
jgi:hypothetical protein